jgi:hypothetical protein
MNADLNWVSKKVIERLKVQLSEGEGVNDPGPPCFESRTSHMMANSTTASHKRPPPSDSLFSPPFKIPKLDTKTPSFLHVSHSNSDALSASASSSANGKPTSPTLLANGLENTLAGLLDVSSLLLDAGNGISHVALHERFAQIASLLLEDCQLCISSQPAGDGGDVSVAKFELLEVEFYLRGPGHLDPFAHGTEEQRVSGKWYVHFHVWCIRVSH